MRGGSVERREERGEKETAEKADIMLIAIGAAKMGVL